MEPDSKQPTRGTRFFQSRIPPTKMEIELEQFIMSMSRRERKPARVFLVYHDLDHMNMIKEAGEKVTPDEMARAKLTHLQQVAGTPFWTEIVENYLATLSSTSLAASMAKLST